MPTSLRQPPVQFADRIWRRVLDPHLYTLTLGEWHLVASFGENDGHTKPEWWRDETGNVAECLTSPPNMPRPNWCLMLWCRNELVRREHACGDWKALLTACRMLRLAQRLSLAIDQCNRLEHAANAAL